MGQQRMTKVFIATLTKKEKQKRFGSLKCWTCGNGCSYGRGMSCGPGMDPICSLCREDQKASEGKLTPAKSASKTSSKKDDSTTGSKKKKVNGAKKGKQFEREIATALGHIFPDAQRELEYQAAGNRGTDIEHTDLFQFQCKRYAGYAPIGKIQEIRLESKNHIPVLVTQGNRMECMAVLPFDKLVTLIEIAYGHAPRLINPYVKEKAQLGGVSPVPALPSPEVPALTQGPEVPALTQGPDVLGRHITATEVEERWAKRDGELNEVVEAMFRPLMDRALEVLTLPPVGEVAEQLSLSSFL